MTLGTTRVIRGNALALPLEDESVDLIVTSPPYWSLRQYTDAGMAYEGQIGGEDTPGEFIDNLVAATREMVRVLKPTGSAFVNLGDKYGPDKSLMDLPHRYAIRAVDELGLIKRAEICWAKPNGLPESVTDRVRRSHEMFFHFVKEPRYYSAVDEIREPSDTIVTPTGAVRYRKPGEVQTPQKRNYTQASKRNTDRGDAGMVGASGNPLGKLPGSVWEIPTQPLQVPDHLGIDHYAAFPLEWPRRIIAGWSPPGICTTCGQGRRPLVHRKPMEWRESPTIAGRTAPGATRKPMSGTMLAAAETTITGYACACPDTTASTTPAVILDPFGGTGTTALAAKAAGRTGITLDMSADYCRLATWRCNDPRELAAAMQVKKPEPVMEGQESLFDGFEAPPKIRGNAGSSLVGVVRYVCDDCGKEANNSRARGCEVCGGNLGRPAKRFQGEAV
jgi:DNA modification methylase